MKTGDFVHGSGKRKTQEQKLHEKLAEYYKKLKKYGKQIAICGEKRNSYCKTDHDATFMRLKRDYMGNDQLLPAYHVQLAVCDGYIAHFGHTETYFQCENCEGCPHRQQCHKANRVVRINQELTALHQEVLGNLNCIHGADKE